MRKARKLGQGILGLIGGMSMASLSGQALGATSGSVVLSGVVPAETSITASGLAGYNSLDLSTTAQDLAVISVREINNTTNGYTVKMSSLNSGSLKNGTLGSVGYTAKYNGTAVTLSSNPVTVTNSGSTTTPVNVAKNFTISYTGADLTTLMQGSYTDTLTFSVTAN
jgi:hypothetical protein